MRGAKIYPFTLNEVYTDGIYFYRFVKVTPKAYDFVNTYTGKCVYQRCHLYDHRYVGKDVEIPVDHKDVEVAINPSFAWKRAMFLNSLVPKAQLESVRRSHA